jgi:hypothetical protein
MLLGKEGGMGHFHLRDLDDEVHSQALARAQSEGRTLSWVIRQALAAYAAGTWAPPAISVPTSAAPRAAQRSPTRRKRPGR